MTTRAGTTTNLGKDPREPVGTVEILRCTFRERPSGEQVVLRERVQTIGADTSRENGFTHEPAIIGVRVPETHQRAVRLLRDFASVLRSPEPDMDVAYGENLLDLMDDCEAFLADTSTSDQRDTFNLINVVQAAAAQRLNRPEEWRSRDLSRVRDAAESLSRVSHFVDEDALGLLDELASAGLYAFDPMSRALGDSNGA